MIVKGADLRGSLWSLQLKGYFHAGFTVISAGLRLFLLVLGNSNRTRFCSCCGLFDLTTSSESLQLAAFAKVSLVGGSYFSSWYHHHAGFCY